MGDDKRRKKKKRGGSKKKLTPDQISAFQSVHEWVYLEHHNQLSPLLSSASDDDFGVQRNLGNCRERFVFELHSHSKCSDGFLSPSKLVERAHVNGVKVLALTDHDTMAGIPEAIEAAQKFSIKIIPGVEISTMYSSGNPETEEPVHILAYYSSCGPSKPVEVENFLASIRDGRFTRARDMITKLNKLKIYIKWEQVARIAGKGVAPGRLHVARAMVESGYVENVKQAFAKYLYDGGPAYSTGSEPPAEEAVQLILETGGLAVLAHPWALKNPVAVIARLQEAGLHGLEVYRSDGKLAVYSDLADVYGLLKLGGSDFHGRGGNSESELGSVNLPVVALHDFLRIARPIWCSSIREIFDMYADNPSDTNLARIKTFCRMKVLKGTTNSPTELIEQCSLLWLSIDERRSADFEALKAKLSHVLISQEGV